MYSRTPSIQYEASSGDAQQRPTFAGNPFADYEWTLGPGGAVLWESLYTQFGHTPTSSPHGIGRGTSL